MKLIIDIDDNVYDDIEHNKGEYINTLNWAVRNGTPISTGGDLISRSKLKKAIEDSDIIHCVTNLWYKDILKEIDNAPTVAEDYDTGYQDGLEDGLNDIRPQGKWILRTDTEWHFECNQCKGLSPWKAQFCGVCGADMRKGGTE